MYDTLEGEVTMSLKEKALHEVYTFIRIPAMSTVKQIARMTSLLRLTWA